MIRKTDVPSEVFSQDTHGLDCLSLVLRQNLLKVSIRDEEEEEEDDDDDVKENNRGSMERPFQY
jgi:hypothetical protein